MSEEKKPLDKAFLMRKLYDDKKHITIEDMMAYIKDECPEEMAWFKGLYLAVDENGKPKHNTLTIKKEFYARCVPKKEAPKKLGRCCRGRRPAADPGPGRRIKNPFTWGSIRAYRKPYSKSNRRN